MKKNIPYTSLSSPCLRRFFAHKILVGLSACVLVFVSAAHATNYSWINASGGTWGQNSNWNPNTGAPTTSSDTAYFKTAGTYTITSSSDYTINTFQTISGSPVVTLDFGGHALNVTNFTLGNGQVILTDGSYGIGTLEEYSSSTGSLTVTGANSSLSVSSNAVLGDNSSYGVLTAQNGASLTFGSRVFVGASSNSTAVLTAKDSGTHMDLGSGFVLVGSSASVGSFSGANGTLMVSNGASATNGYFVILGNYSTPANTATASFIVKDAGSSYQNTRSTAYIGVGGNSSTGYAASTARLSVYNGGTLSITQAIYDWQGGTVYVGSGSSITSSAFYSNYNNTSAEKTSTVMGSGSILATTSNASVLLYGNVKPGDTLSDSGIVSTGTGTLTIGDGVHAAAVKLSQNTTTTLDFADASHFDKIVVNGSISKGANTDLGTLVLNFNFTPAANTEYDLFTTTGGFSGSFSSIVWNGAAQGTYGVSGDGKTFYIITAGAVPEPSSVALMAMAGVALFYVAKRRPVSRR